MDHKQVLIHACMPPGNPWKTPEEQTVGCDSISEHAQHCSPCKHFRVLSMLALQREAAWAEERLLGHLRQPVPKTAASITHYRLSVQNNRNRRKIAAFSNPEVQNRKFYCRNRRKIARKSQKSRCDFLGCGIKIAAFPRFKSQRFGTLRL